MEEKNRVEDHSNDRKYFTITPRLVWMLVEDVYQLALWVVIKDIAGEDGQCFLSTPDLASLAMMSVGKASQCRKRLIELGLLEGAIEKDPGYPQAVWHLSIPDLWEKNIRSAHAVRSLKDRIDLKTRQLESLHVVKASPHEGGTTPHEGLPSPHETKNNHKEDPPEKREYTDLEVKVISWIRSLAMERYANRQMYEGIVMGHIEGTTVYLLVGDPVWYKSRLHAKLTKGIAGVINDANCQVIFLNYDGTETPEEDRVPSF